MGIRTFPYPRNVNAEVCRGQASFARHHTRSVKNEILSALLYFSAIANRLSGSGGQSLVFLSVIVKNRGKNLPS
jgi:hypothetical protein